MSIPAVCEGKATIPLWPDAAKLLGISKTSTYAAAKRGDFPGAFRVGHAHRVAVAPLLRHLGIEDQPAERSESSNPEVAALENVTEQSIYPRNN